MTNINPALKKELLNSFKQLLADMKNPKEVELFINSFLTEEELDRLIKRLGGIYWIKKGRTTENIKNNLKLSAKQVGEINKIIGKAGIKLALKYLEAEEFANIWASKINKYLKRK